MIPFWCLMPKGEKIKAKEINGSATSYHLRILKIIELESLFVKILLFALIVKSGSLEGRRFNYGKKGEFLNT